MRLDRAKELASALIAALSVTPGVRSIESAGSFRRRRESIGDLDLLAETDQPAALMDGSPPRLDLAVERARRAAALGCLLSIDSDVHDIHELDYVRWGSARPAERG